MTLPKVSFFQLRPHWTSEPYGKGSGVVVVDDSNIIWCSWNNLYKISMIFWKKIIKTKINNVIPLHISRRWNKIESIFHLYNVHVLLSWFYPDFILSLSWFYPDFIYILSRFYPDFLKTHFIQILSWFYPNFWKYLDKIRIKSG